ncbi:MAG: hypothetical protein DRG39_06720 [Deltaproteobacteria bacterium]|nr:MAG: hypothetical protein DRG39_06720 [Deltaproteobacteria bacterium]
MDVELNIYWIKSPLKKPYYLSIGTIHEFDSIVVLINNGQDLYWGEATALPGYSWETAETMWKTTIGCAEDSSDLTELRNNALSFYQKNPFATSAILTALDKYQNLKELYNGLSNKNISIPLAGIVNGVSPEELSMNAEKVMSEGYKVLKIKLLGDLNRDIDRIKTIQEMLKPGIKLRFDANQSYDYEMLEKILKTIDPDTTELLEQPFKVDRWDLLQEVVRWSPVPIMLDESIWNLEDLKKAHEKGVSFVKLKLVKHGGMLNSLTMIKKARKMGFQIILGNGVQTDLGCMDECILYEIGQLECAGEMNGFLKLRDGLINKNMKVIYGVLSLTLKDISLGSIRFINNVCVFKKYKKIMHL